MNISPDGITVRCKIIDEELFEAEKSGAKCNVMKLIDVYEFEELSKKLPEKIIVQHDQEIFLRALSHVYITDRVFGSYKFAIFSWTHNKHHHPIPSEEKPDLRAHNMSIDELQLDEPPLYVQAINISLPLREKLDNYRDDRTYDELISDMLKNYLSSPPQDPATETTEWHGGP